MTRHPFSLLLLAGALALACRDASAPEQATSGGDSNPAGSPPALSTSDFLSLYGGSDILVGDSLGIRGYLMRPASAPADTLDWVVNDATLAGIEVTGKDQVVIHALRAGDLVLSAHTRSILPRLEASAKVRIHLLSPQPAAIDVSEFYVVESWNQAAGRYLYAPQLALRASGPDPVRIFSVTLELPEGGLSAYCQVDQTVAAVSPLFAPLVNGGEMEFFYGIGQRLPPTAQPVATITVSTPDGAAARLVARGRIEPGAVIPGYNEAPPGNWVWCGSW